MNTESVVTIVAAFAGSGAIVTITNYITGRRKANVDSRIAEQSEHSQVAIIGMQEMEAKLKYFSQIISDLQGSVSSLQQRNELTLQESDRAYERYIKVSQANRELADKILEQEEKIDHLIQVIRRLCKLADLDASIYLEGME